MKKSGLADSPFFSPTAQEQVQGEVKRTLERNSERTENRSEKHTEALPTKRRTKRYSFEFYDDQLIKLKHLKYQAEMDGKILSLSDIVRVALDAYLQDK
ncbi:MAG: hypothetical protein ABI700_02195 [Chloroflexota bacterium]